jgi:hypothetical protein
MPKGAEKLLAFQDPDHHRFFEEFAYYDRLAGGPDSHMATVGWLTKDDPQDIRLWKIGLYLGVYNVPTAEALWHQFPDPYNLPPARGVEDFLTARWDGIATRRERRSVRTPIQLAGFITSLRDWVVWADKSGWWHDPNGYEVGWESVNRIYSVGRYIAIKLLEAAHRYCGLAAVLSDLRAKDGWSPREGLALMLDPEYAVMMCDPRTPIEWVERVAEAHRLSHPVAGIKGLAPLDRYEHQVFLCDYKQSYVGQRQYPGRSLDSEIDYWLVVRDHWPEVEFRMFEARLALFPDECLGERRGWHGVRKELGLFLREKRQTWSDLLYDYPSMEARA